MNPAASVSRSTCASTKRAVPPVASISAATRLPRPTSRSAKATFAPSATNRRTVASPMPDAPPVTAAIFPLSRSMSTASLRYVALLPVRRAPSGASRAGAQRYPGLAGEVIGWDGRGRGANAHPWKEPAAMKAIRVSAYGGPEVLKLEEIPAPKPDAGQVLVRNHAVGVNPVDTYLRSNTDNRGPKPPNP